MTAVQSQILQESRVQIIGKMSMCCEVIIIITFCDIYGFSSATLLLSCLSGV